MKKFAKRDEHVTLNNDIVVYEPYFTWLEERSEVVYSLKHERMGGVPFNRMSTKQSWIVGSLFTIVSFIVVLL